MKEKNASSTLVVTDPEMAKVLGDPENLRYIAPFLEHEHTVSDIASEVGTTLSTTYRKIKRYCALGILEVAREQKRKGKAIKVYRAVAAAFFVPLQLGDGAEEGSARWQAHWEGDFQRGFRYAFEHQLDGWGQRLYRRDGVFTIMLAKGPNEEVDVLEEGMPALYNRFHDSLHLDFAEAKAFQRELDALFVRYSKQKGQQRYMMRISFVPVPADAKIIR